MHTCIEIYIHAHSLTDRHNMRACTCIYAMRTSHIKIQTQTRSRLSCHCIHTQLYTRVTTHVQTHRHTQKASTVTQPCNHATTQPRRHAGTQPHNHTGSPRKEISQNPLPQGTYPSSPLPPAHAPAFGRRASRNLVHLWHMHVEWHM